jgi:hypothetical protein
MIILIFLLGLAFGQTADADSITLSWEEFSQSTCEESLKAKEQSAVAYMVSELHLKTGFMLADYHHELTTLYTKIQLDDWKSIRRQRMKLSAAISRVLPAITQERVRLRKVGLLFRGNVTTLRNGEFPASFPVKKKRNKAQAFDACSLVMTACHQSLVQAYSVLYKAKEFVWPHQESYENAVKSSEENSQALDFLQDTVLNQPLHVLPTPESLTAPTQ